MFVFAKMKEFLLGKRDLRLRLRLNFALFLFVISGILDLGEALSGNDGTRKLLEVGEKRDGVANSSLERHGYYCASIFVRQSEQRI